MLVITGITGHSGRYLLKELIQNNYSGKIRCIVRENSDVSLLKQCNLDLELCYGDLKDSVFMDEALNGAETVMHIASIFCSEYVIKSALKNHVNRAIFVHTTGIYSKYKSASEEYMQIEKNIKDIIKSGGSSIDLIYLRPTMIYGYTNDRNMIVFIKMVDKLRLFPIINHGKNLLQPVNGRDLGIAYYKLLMKTDIRTGDYILSGEKQISMLELFKLISQILNKKTVFLNVPMVIGFLGAKTIKFVSFGRIDYVEKVQRMGEDRHFSHDKATLDFDYQPMALSEGLKIEIEEYLHNKSK